MGVRATREVALTFDMGVRATREVGLTWVLEQLER